MNSTEHSGRILVEQTGWEKESAYLMKELALERKRRIDLEKELETLRPRVLFADSVMASDSSIPIGSLAKILKQNGMNIGRNRLFELLRLEGFLCKSGEQFNLPTQKSMERGFFEIQQQTVTRPDGSVKVSKTTKVTGKGQVFFVNRYCQGIQTKILGNGEAAQS